MPFRKHDRQYDLVIFGATGYTGKLTAKSICDHAPTNLRWAVAGRSRGKLEQVVAECQHLDQNRLEPHIEVCDVNDSELAVLARKTFIMITAVGPYGRLGEHAFKACVENGTHYLDVTGEVPFVARMIKKYEATARANGVVMFPQIGLESAPSDLLTWTVAAELRRSMNAQTRDVTMSIRTLDGRPSGGTWTTVFTLFDNFSLAELRAAHVPYALSPVARGQLTRPSLRPPVSRLTGLVTYPTLGRQTSSIAARTDSAIVERTWGMLRETPALRSQFYGPNFSFRQHFAPRSWLDGVRMHWSLVLFGLLLVLRPLRMIASRFFYQAGEGRSSEEAKDEELEIWAIADPDVGGEVKERAFCKARYKGQLYYLCGILVSQAALTILDENFKLKGGIYTPACLGRPYIDRLGEAGFEFQSKMIPV